MNDENTHTNWYATKAGSQGLIIDEDTGRNVAVAYDVKDARLLAAAPTMLAALKLVDIHWEVMPLKVRKAVADAINMVEETE